MTDGVYDNYNKLQDSIQKKGRTKPRARTIRLFICYAFFVCGLLVICFEVWSLLEDRLNILEEKTIMLSTESRRRLRDAQYHYVK